MFQSGHVDLLVPGAGLPSMGTQPQRRRRQHLVPQLQRAAAGHCMYGDGAPQHGTSSGSKPLAGAFGSGRR